MLMRVKVSVSIMILSIVVNLHLYRWHTVCINCNVECHNLVIILWVPMLSVVMLHVVKVCVSIMILSITTFSIMVKKTSLCIQKLQCWASQFSDYSERPYAECCYAEHHDGVCKHCVSILSITTFSIIVKNMTLSLHKLYCRVSQFNDNSQSRNAECHYA